MLLEKDIIKIFCGVDDFCKSFEKDYERNQVSDGKIKRRRKGNLSLSEVVTIMIIYHQSGMSCFKHFYYYLLLEKKDLFKNLVHYDSFIRLIKKSFPAFVYLLKSLYGKVTEYTFIDATPYSVCYGLREGRHKVFKGMAEKGKTSTGWLFGLKLHIIFNTQGEIVRMCITPGNINDRKPVPDLLEGITTKLIGDKGYISKKLFDKLFENETTLITKVKKNMKNCLLLMKDKLMLKKRSFVETIFSSLKSLHTFVHHRHRCPINAFSHILAALASYQLRDDKPTLDPKIFIIS